MTLNYHKEPLRICNRCGFEAHDESELELFKKSQTGQHGRQNLCKECYNKFQLKYNNKISSLRNIFKPLRLCRICGLEAWEEEDLKLFKKMDRLPHGRDNLCKS